MSSTIVERPTGVRQHRVERLRLLERARKAVEQEAARGIGLGQPLADDADDHVVGHELAGVHVLLRREAELGARLQRGAQHVAGRDVRHAEGGRDALGLRAFAGPRRTEQHDVELFVCHDDPRGTTSGSPRSGA